MHTLADLLTQTRSLSSVQETRGGLAGLVRPKSRLIVPGGNSIALPTDLRGLERVSSIRAVPGLDETSALGARLSLMYQPGIAIALAPPDHATLVSLGLEPEKFRNENPRCVGTAVAFARPTSSLLFGTARMIVVENGLRMGSSEAVLLDDQWTDEIEDVEQVLLELYLEATSVRIGPEPGSPPWKTVVALLGGNSKSDKLPPTWQRDMRIAAGLRALNLKISPSPESARVRVIQELRERPPEALLVWVNWVAHPESFIQPFLVARPEAYAEILGSRESPREFPEDLSEFVMHLREISPTVGYSDLSPETVTTWEAAAAEIEQLAGPHFRLTQRALGMLKGNPYPMPGRMLMHVRALANLALAYHQANGQIGGRLSDLAMSDYGLDIALFDSSLTFPAVVLDARSLYAEKHVKVDDFKRPDRCGRIYFLIDDDFSFIVDHIGLHDYGQ